MSARGQVAPKMKVQDTMPKNLTSCQQPACLPFAIMEPAPFAHDDMGVRSCGRKVLIDTKLFHYVQCGLCVVAVHICSQCLKGGVCMCCCSTVDLNQGLSSSAWKLLRCWEKCSWRQFCAKREGSSFAIHANRQTKAPHSDFFCSGVVTVCHVSPLEC